MVHIVYLVGLHYVLELTGKPKILLSQLKPSQWNKGQE